MRHLLKYYIALQPKIKKAMGEWRPGDVLYCMRQETFHYTHEQDCCDLRIPLTIDPVNPERGLWGMLEGHKTLGEGTDVVVFVDNHIEVTGATPTEAILKALCHQEGVEVK